MQGSLRRFAPSLNRLSLNLSRCTPNLARLSPNAPSPVPRRAAWRRLRALSRLRRWHAHAHNGVRLGEELRGDVLRGVQLILVCKLVPNSFRVAITSHVPKHHALSPPPTASPLDVTWLIYGPHCRRNLNHSTL